MVARFVHFQDIVALKAPASECAACLVSEGSAVECLTQCTACASAKCAQCTSSTGSARKTGPECLLDCC